MKDSFIFEGKKYISAKRASEISDYSSDYIGQLCRAYKLDSRRIGRSWFITEESLEKHKSTVLLDEIVRNRIENLKGRKKSLKKTSTVSKIRKVEVAATVASVEKKNVEEVSNEEKIGLTKPSDEFAGVNPIAKTSIVSDEKKEVVVAVGKAETNLKEEILSSVEPRVPRLDWKVTFVSSEYKPLSNYRNVLGLTYLSDDRPLLPTLKKGNVASAVNVIKSPTAVSSSPQTVSLADVVKEAIKIKPIVKTVPPVAKVPVPHTVMTDSVVTKISVAKPVKRVETKISPVTVSKTEGVPSNLEILKKTGPAVPILARAIILGRVLSKVATIVLVVGLGFSAIIFVRQNSDRLAGDISRLSQSAEANVYESLDAAVNFFREGYRSVLAFFTLRPMQITMNEPEQKPAVSVSTTDAIDTSSVLAPNGMAIVPSAGSNDLDQAVKEKIQNSFSDEVEINPDQSGTAGVIKPVFKETRGKDFIYVMVPVKEFGSDAVTGSKVKVEAMP